MIETATRTSRLNAIQRMMLQWSELHPYNASHIYRLAGTPDPDRLRAAIQETFAFNRLGAVEIANGGRYYRVESSSAPDVQVIAGGSDPVRSLTTLVAEDMNRLFARPGGCPLRFALISSGPETHYLVNTYD